MSGHSRIKKCPVEKNCDDFMIVIIVLKCASLYNKHFFFFLSIFEFKLEQEICLCASSHSYRRARPRAAIKKMQLTKRSRESLLLPLRDFFFFSFSFQDAPTPSSVIHENFEKCVFIVLYAEPYHQWLLKKRTFFFIMKNHHHHHHFPSCVCSLAELFFLSSSFGLFMHIIQVEPQCSAVKKRDVLFLARLVLMCVETRAECT